MIFLYFVLSMEVTFCHTTQFLLLFWRCSRPLVSTHRKKDLLVWTLILEPYFRPEMKTINLAKLQFSKLIFVLVNRKCVSKCSSKILSFGNFSSLNICPYTQRKVLRKTHFNRKYFRMLDLKNISNISAT